MRYACNPKVAYNNKKVPKLVPLNWPREQRN